MMIWGLIALILCGLIIGSFINMLAHRLPILIKREWHIQSADFLNQPITIETTQLSLWQPGSFCPHCQHTLRWWHNIPLLSFLILRGRCGHCHARIAPRYLITELLCALSVVPLFYHLGIDWILISACVLTWGLIAISVIDIEEQFIPDAMTYCLLWLGLLSNIFYLFTTPENAILGAMTGYLFFWLIGNGFKWLRGKEGLGYGDFKLLAMLGAWLGVYALFNIVLIASVTGIIIMAVMMILKRHRANQPFPFGPFLAFGGWCTMLFGDVVTNFFTR